MSAGDKARDAIYDRIASGADDADPKDLDLLASAYHRVTFGAQGGSMHYRYEADNHDTKHEGENRSRPSPGFSPGAGS